MIVIFIVASVFAFGIVLCILELLRRLFWLALRLTAGAAVAIVGAITAVGVASPGAEWTAAPVALALAALTIWLTGGWGDDSRHVNGRAALVGRRIDPAITQNTAPPSVSPILRNSLESKPASLHPDGTLSSSYVPPLAGHALCQRLVLTEKALVRAARNQLGQPATEWLIFWHRRVPDLIDSAQEVYNDADDAEKADVAVRLANHLENIIAEANHRLGRVLAARRDVFNICGQHAEGQIQNG